VIAVGWHSASEASQVYASSRIISTLRHLNASFAPDMILSPEGDPCASRERPGSAGAPGALSPSTQGPCGRAGGTAIIRGPTKGPWPGRRADRSGARSAPPVTSGRGEVFAEPKPGLGSDWFGHGRDRYFQKFHGRQRRQTPGAARLVCQPVRRCFPRATQFRAALETPDPLLRKGGRRDNGFSPWLRGLLANRACWLAPVDPVH